MLIRAQPMIESHCTHQIDTVTKCRKGFLTCESPIQRCETITQWARHNDNIRALVVTGSLARHDGTSDHFSDLDLQVITPDVKRFTVNDKWLNELGEVWIRFPLNRDLPYRLVWFRGGTKVDFQFLDHWPHSRDSGRRRSAR